MKISATQLRSYGYEVNFTSNGRTIEGSDDITEIRITSVDGQCFLPIDMRKEIVSSLMQGSSLTESQAVEVLDAMDKKTTDIFIWNLITRG